MKSIFLVIKSNYKKQKTQHILVGISLALASILSGVAGGILSTMQEPFDMVFNKLHASHFLLFFDNRSYDISSVRTWFAHQPEVSRVGEANPYIMHNGPLIYNEKKIDVMAQVTERTADNVYQDMLMSSDSVLKNQPRHGEMWIPNYLANNYHIKLGDSIGLSVPSGFCRFRISAVVVDPHYSSGMINPTRIWIAPGEMSLLYPATRLTQVMVSIRLKDVGNGDILWTRFNRQFRFTGNMLQYSLFKSAFTSMYQIISAILILFSLLAFILAFFLINSNIKAAIHSEYKTIGIYKVLGFLPGDLVSLLMIQFGALALIVVPFSLLVSYYLLKVVIGMLTRSLGVFQMNLQLFIPFLILGACIILLILIVCRLAGRRAAQVNIAEAIRFGLPVASLNIEKDKYNFRDSSLPVPALLGIKLMVFNKRRSMVTFMSAMFAVFILVFSINIAFSFSDLKNNKPAWGFDNGDIQLSRNTTMALPLTHEQFQELMNHEKNVRYCIPFSYHNLIFLTPAGEPLREIYGRAYFDELSKAGLVNQTGRNPIQKNEISLCTGTMLEIKKHVGDSVLAFLEGESRFFRITGSYQDVSNMGQGFRLQGASITESNPLFRPSNYSLILKEGSKADLFKTRLQAVYGEAIHVELSIEERIALMGIISNMQMSLAFLSLIFLMVLIISIWNDNIGQVREQQKNFGAMKVMGLSVFQLRISLVCRNAALTLLAIIAGVPLALFGSPLLMSLFTGGIGLIRFPFLINKGGTISILFVILVFSLIASWLSSHRLARIKPMIHE
jgi:putative ABC transport system permease protein